MYLFISILILITCVLLGIVVLVQNSKGGGLAANFSSQNQIMGVRKTADFLEKATWTLVIVLFALSLISIFAIPKKVTAEDGSTQIKTELTTDNAVATPSAIPQQPVQQQQQQAQPQQEAQQPATK